MTNETKYALIHWGPAAATIIGCVIAYFALKLQPLSLLIGFGVGCVCTWYLIGKKKVLDKT